MKRKNISFIFNEVVVCKYGYFSLIILWLYFFIPCSYLRQIEIFSIPLTLVCSFLLVFLLESNILKIFSGSTELGKSDLL